MSSPPSTVIRNFLLAALLLIGTLIIYLPDLVPAFGKQSPLALDDAQTYVADLDFWQRTERERTVVANARFDLDVDLTSVPLTVGDWQGEEVPETNQEVMILLDPEQYVQRLYYNSEGQYLWLTMIGGRSSQPFHAPDICYDADGWQYNLGSQAVTLEQGGEIYGLWLEAAKVFPGEEELTEQIAYYFYLFPDDRRRLEDGIVLFKVTTGRYGTTEETLALQAEFVRHLFNQAA